MYTRAHTHTHTIHTRFPNWEQFEAKHKAYGEGDTSSLSSLHHELEPYLFRRIKKDVEKSLPAKVGEWPGVVGGAWCGGRTYDKGEGGGWWDGWEAGGCGVGGRLVGVGWREAGWYGWVGGRLVGVGREGGHHPLLLTGGTDSESGHVFCTEAVLQVRYRADGIHEDLMELMVCVCRWILTKNYKALSRGVKGSITGFINIVMELKKCCNHIWIVREPDSHHTGDPLQVGLQ